MIPGSNPGGAINFFLYILKVLLIYKIAHSAVHPDFFQGGLSSLHLHRQLVSQGGVKTFNHNKYEGY